MSGKPVRLTSVLIHVSSSAAVALNFAIISLA